ncbi:similar to ribulose-1,5-bisphosphate carboxylase [Halorhodospira halochloris]|uniref:Similar to ribulose-1,5-bisphosphate carboxylase n=1 Tax=Halorhodospira halochloris TaxID=1052 RepID=A0A0X8XB70_HALHR|nr:RuBisCO large subunit C-terminal-like domain-containing protein [Halorhodospira halochloris]MBK1651843.1 ribulose 1,5-bisphosphate carboxylase [Halorhodospira halochloris]BAU58822.1 similar to ribulose-1,5-bisphosphate carboxylase [Halorhodospira halochloris]
MSDVLRVTYLITCREGEDPEDKARGIALEQSAELPSRCIPEHVYDQVVPRIVTLEPISAGRYQLVLDFPEAITGYEPTQLINNLFGNISLKSGIRLHDVEWTPKLLSALGGPRFGTSGVRRLLGADNRPLTSTALKPLGLDTKTLAGYCTDFAHGGIDLIKDDHGLCNQATSPYLERLQACQDAVNEANAATGGNSLYLPNVTAPRGQLEQRLEAAQQAGCKAVLICPFITGLDALIWARDNYDLALMAHPAFAGAVAGAEHGIDPALQLGEITRLFGADMVVYTNAEGRFPTYDQELCDRINDRLWRPLGDIRPALPTPGGGVDAARAPYWVERYGPDVVLLIGGSLYAQGDLRAAARRLQDVVEGR